MTALKVQSLQLMQASVLKKQHYHNGSTESARGNPQAFSDVWRIHSNPLKNFYVMYRSDRNGISFAPLYIHIFCFKIPHHLTRAQTFIHDNPEPDKLDTVSDKLKYYRFQHGLLQKDVADFIGVDRSTYLRYEENILDSYPLDKLSKAAELFKVDVTELLDEYNLFIFNGQGRQIKELRKSMKLTQSEFAKVINSNSGNVKSWEQDKVRIQRNTFDKLLLVQRNRAP